MADQTSLIPPTNEERLYAIRGFIEEEIYHRGRMIENHPERYEYWKKRLDQAETARDHVDALIEPPKGCPDEEHRYDIVGPGLPIPEGWSILRTIEAGWRVISEDS